jgi:hypothetical protein
VDVGVFVLVYCIGGAIGRRFSRSLARHLGHTLASPAFIWIAMGVAGDVTLRRLSRDTVSLAHTLGHYELTEKVLFFGSQ